jgi:hypothetical protein
VEPAGADEVTTVAVEAPGPGEARTPVAGDADGIEGTGTDRTGTEGAAAPAAFEGRVVVVLADGTRLEAESGRVAATVFVDGAGDPRELSIERGRFRIEGVDPARVGRIWLDGGVLGGRPVEGATAAARWNAASGAPPRLEVVPSEGWTLRVVAAESGLALDDVRGILVHANPAELQGPYHPGPDRADQPPLVGPGPSPLAVPARAMSARGPFDTHLAVGAPGRVWRCVPLDAAPDDGGPSGSVREVALERAGALEIAITGVRRAADLRFELDRAAGRVGPVVELELDGDLELALDGLAPGDWVGRVFRGNNSAGGRVFAEAEVRVQVGEVAALALEVPAEAFEREALFATVLLVDVPAGADLEGERFDVARLAAPDGDARRSRGRLEDPVELGDGRTRYSIDLRRVPAGTYAFRLFQHPTLRAFEVDGSGTSRLAVPAATPRRVRVFEPDGVTPAEVARFTWRPALAEGGALSTAGEVETEAPGVYAFEAPDQSLTLSVRRADGHQRTAALDPADWSLVDGLRTHDWVLAPRARIVVRYRMDGAPYAIDPPSFVGPRLETLEGDWPPDTSSVTTPEHTEFRVLPGRRLRVLPPALDGYEAPEPVEVEPQVGGGIELDLEYTSERP